MAQLINRAPFAVDTPGFPRGRAAAFWPSRRRFVTFFSAALRREVMHSSHGNSTSNEREEVEELKTEEKALKNDGGIVEIIKAIIESERCGYPSLED